MRKETWVILSWCDVEDVCLVVDENGDVMVWSSEKEAVKYGEEKCAWNFKAIELGKESVR